MGTIKCAKPQSRQMMECEFRERENEKVCDISLVAFPHLATDIFAQITAIEPQLWKRENFSFSLSTFQSSFQRSRRLQLQGLCGFKTVK